MVELTTTIVIAIIITTNVSKILPEEIHVKVYVYVNLDNNNISNNFNRDRNKCNEKSISNISSNYNKHRNYIYYLGNNYKKYYVQVNSDNNSDNNSNTQNKNIYSISSNITN